MPPLTIWMVYHLIFSFVTVSKRFRQLREDAKRGLKDEEAVITREEKNLSLREIKQTVGTGLKLSAKD